MSSQLNLLGQQAFKFDSPEEAPIKAEKSKLLLSHEEITDRLKGGRTLFWKKTSVHRYPEVWAYSIPQVRKGGNKDSYRIHKGILNLRTGKFETCDTDVKDKEATLRFVEFILDNGCKPYDKKGAGNGKGR